MRMSCYIERIKKIYKYLRDFQLKVVFISRRKEYKV